MTPEDLLSEVKMLGLSARLRRGEVQLEVCPHCGNRRWNMELSATKNVYHCWACRSSGVLASIIRDLGGNPPDELGDVSWEPGTGGRSEPAPEMPASKPATEVASAGAFLRRRGILPAEADRLSLSVCIEPGHQHRLRIMVPLYEYWSGRPAGFVSRSYLGEDPKYMNALQIPVSLPGWRAGDVGVHALTEGPFDALSYVRAGYGAACLLGLGRRDAAVEWASRAPEEDLILVSLDGEAGDRIYSLLHALSPVHKNVRPVYLPSGMDPGELRPDVVRSLVDRAANISQEES